ncbi:MAG TPA: hypothetical protein DIU35_16685 [Candidatus Latescibacteria bacterium]|nr:hypothetical protein [Gemmatimonadota bacterium]HCR19116.1 hypothetical protein [Candidatus Latescibacterota bacterium]
MISTGTFGPAPSYGGINPAGRKASQLGESVIRCSGLSSDKASEGRLNTKDMEIQSHFVMF